VAYQIPLTIKDTLENIARGRFVLPAIQRELVWAQEPSRMTRLFDSILRGYPIGTFLFWQVTPEQSKEFHFYEFMLNWHERKHRHNRLHLGEPRELTAILDGQQLLLSIATAQFEGRDAREEIHGLVDDLNDTKPGFKFTKDLVLKAGLVLTDISDVGFRVENFTATNMKILDEKWEDVERALRIGVKLLSSFGFSESSLPAASVLIPLADYIHQRGLDESYVTSATPSVRADRAVVRHWTIRTILKPGIWGSALDQLLRALHQALKESSGGFPIESIEAEMAKRGKSLAFDADLLDELVDTPYKHKRTFALLTLLYDWVDTRNEFHVDHVFPRSLATGAKLRDHGVDQSDFEEFGDKIERLANLQLLAGPENIQKRAQLPGDWVRGQYAGEEARNAWLAGHDLHGLPADLVDFLPFYGQRRAVVRERLARLLGARPDEVRKAATDAPVPADLPASDTSPPASVSADRSRPVSRPGAVTKRRYETSMADLVAAGVIAPGAVLRKTYHGTAYEVSVRDDGRLEASGEVFESLSQAARLLTGQKAVNGWAFWLTAAGTPVGDLRPGS